MTPPLWLRVKVKLFVENYLTPALCALGVVAYSAAVAKWPFIVGFLAQAGIDAAFVSGFIVAAMAFLANTIDRKWAAPVFQPPMTKTEAIAEVKAEIKVEAK